MADWVDPSSTKIEISIADNGPLYLIEKDPHRVHPCRLCFTPISRNEKDVTSLLQQVEGNMNLSSQLKLFFQLEFEESELWPHFICGNCVNFITQMQVFKDKIMATHCTLYRSILKPTPKVELKKGEIVKTAKTRRQIILIKERTPEEVETLIAHMTTLDVLRCNICRNKKFDKWDDMTNHFGTHHPFTTPFLLCCNTPFKGREQALDHMDWHLNPDEAFKCATCSAQFQNYSQLIRHENSARHRERRYKCGTCQMAFKKRDRLKHHEAIHLPIDQRPCLCTYCGKRFTAKGMLKRHIERVHEVSDRFQCETCGRQFSEKGYLWMHQKSHDPEWLEKNREYQRNKLAQKRAVTGARKRKSNREKRADALHESQKCQFCNLNSRNMPHHMRNHHIEKYVLTEEEAKIVACETCGKEVEQYKMGKHKARHEFTPKTCEICKEALKSSSTYFAHMAMHRQKRFPCSHCPLVFNKMWARYSHFRSDHPVEFKQQYKGKKALD